MGYPIDNYGPDLARGDRGSALAIDCLGWTDEVRKLPFTVQGFLHEVVFVHL